MQQRSCGASACGIVQSRFVALSWAPAMPHCSRSNVHEAQELLDIPEDSEGSFVQSVHLIPFPMLSAKPPVFVPRSYRCNLCNVSHTQAKLFYEQRRRCLDLLNLAERKVTGIPPPPAGAVQYGSIHLRKQYNRDDDPFMYTPLYCIQVKRRACCNPSSRKKSVSISSPPVSLTPKLLKWMPSSERKKPRRMLHSCAKALLRFVLHVVLSVLGLYLIIGKNLCHSRR